MIATLIDHERWCPAVTLTGLTEPRIEQYVMDRRDEHDRKVGAVHCCRCVECGEIRYTELV